jgi:hypothetical protein
MRGSESETQYIITILNEDGLELIPGPNDGSGSISQMPIIVPPGATRNDRPVLLNTTYTLVPGKYSVQFACHVDPNDSKSPMVKSNWITIAVTSATEKPPLTFTISGPKTVTVGAILRLQVVQKNTSDHKITLVAGAYYDVLIRDENGKEPDLKPGIMAGSIRFGELQPQETFTEVAGVPYDLHPGRYTVQLSRHFETWNTTSPVITSNKITIIVTDAANAPPTAETPQAESELGLELILHADRTTVMPKEDVILYAKWVNHSRSAIMCNPDFSTSKIDERYLFDVRTSDGRPVPRIDNNPTHYNINRPCGVGPGGEMDALVGCINCAFAMRNPGLYTVQVSYRDLPSGQAIGKSNKVTITVIEK